MNSKHAKILAAVLAKPTSGTVAWIDIERLLIAVGCAIVEGRGSRVRFEKDGLIASFHRPHPAQEAKRYQVEDARDYLTRLGVTGDGK